MKLIEQESLDKKELKLLTLQMSDLWIGVDCLPKINANIFDFLWEMQQKYPDFFVRVKWFEERFDLSWSYIPKFTKIKGGEYLFIRDKRSVKFFLVGNKKRTLNHFYQFDGTFCPYTESLIRQNFPSNPPQIQLAK